MVKRRAFTREQIQTCERLREVWSKRAWSLKHTPRGVILVGRLIEGQEDGVGPVRILLTNRGRTKPYRPIEGEEI